MAEALGAEALVIEKAKSNVLGAYLCAQEAETGRIPALFGQEEVLTTFVTNILRSVRFGTADPTGQANILVYNYLLQNKAVVWNATGRYTVDYAKTWDALEKLGTDILRIQALSDREAASAYLQHYGEADMKSQADKRTLERAGIPIDIRFQYEYDRLLWQ